MAKRTRSTIGRPGYVKAAFDRAFTRVGARTGLDPAPVRWYEAFAQWKTAVVVQQVHIRWRQGASADPRHERIADTVPALAATAIWLLDEAGL